MSQILANQQKYTNQQKYCYVGLNIPHMEIINTSRAQVKSRLYYQSREKYLFNDMWQHELQLLMSSRVAEGQLFQPSDLQIRDLIILLH